MKLWKAVLDTNVVVSAHLNAEGFERHAFDLGLSRRIQLFITSEILDEYKGVLCRAKFGLREFDVEESIQLLQRSARIVRPTRSINVTKDPADNKFLQCAEVAEAEFVVTGNLRHFPARYRAVQVVNARRFLELIASDLRR